LVGVAFPRSAFSRPVLALRLYSMLPVLATPLRPQRRRCRLLEAAEGVGMTARQSLVSVGIAAALPVIMAGIRTAAVWVIGPRHCRRRSARPALKLYLRRPADPELGCSAVRLSGVGCAGAGGRPMLALIENGIRNRSAFARRSAAPACAAWSRPRLVPALARSPSNYIVGAKTLCEQYVLSR